MKRNTIAIALLSLIILLTGCKKYNEPEYSIPKYTGKPANRTIADIKAAYDPEKGTYDSVWTAASDFIVDAVVVSSDEGGNFYKAIVVQDETGAIEIEVNASGLYTMYGVGQRVLIDCKGLCVDISGKKISGLKYGYYRLGWIYRDAVGQINGNDFSKFVTRDSLPNPANAVPMEVNASNVATLSATAKLQNDPNVCKLVRLKNCMFSPSDVGKPLSEELTSTDRQLWSIDGVPVTAFTVRTSNYSKIRGIKIPDGPCDLIGILSKYGQTYQLELRIDSDMIKLEPEQPNNNRNGGENF